MSLHGITTYSVYFVNYDVVFGNDTTRSSDDTIRITVGINVFEQNNLKYAY